MILNLTFLSPGIKYKKSGRPRIDSHLQLQNEEKIFVISQSAKKEFHFNFCLTGYFIFGRWAEKSKF